MKTIDPKDVNPVESLQLLTAAIAPRPIALVSTVSVEGQHNLAPFSFFNAVGSNPPYIVFSPSRRARDGSLKDTYYNLAETGECVVHVVNHALVWQMNIASGEYDRGINEFEKAGFTPIDSQKISPKRIKESPIHMECELVSMTQLGGLPGSGNMALCRVLLFHVDEALYSENGLSVERIHHVGRNGAGFYTDCRMENLFELHMPRQKIGIGYDALPKKLRSSSVLSAKHLSMLASMENVPDQLQYEEWVRRFSKEKVSSKDQKKAFSEKNVAYFVSTMIQNKVGVSQDQIETWMSWAIDQGQTEVAWNIWTLWSQG